MAVSGAFRPALERAAAETGALIGDMIAALPASDVASAMAHACAGGKGLRAFLVLEGAALHGAPRERALRAAAAIEMIHAYSLVHDDLPCMDDDSLRRGRPTVHVKWTEATAVLAGDALQSLAFEVLADQATSPDGEVRARLIGALARAAGARGMVLGQALDIAAETAALPLSLEEVTALQQGKTGALFGWAATAGAVLAGADPQPLRQYAGHLGLAFQIADDILDVEGDAQAAGKRLGKDAGRGKATFVSLLGLERARARAQGEAQAACAALSPYGAAANPLREAALFAISRDR